MLGAFSIQTFSILYSLFAIPQCILNGKNRSQISPIPLRELLMVCTCFYRPNTAFCPVFSFYCLQIPSVTEKLYYIGQLPKSAPFKWAFLEFYLHSTSDAHKNVFIFPLDTILNPMRKKSPRRWLIYISFFINKNLIHCLSYSATNIICVYSPISLRLHCLQSFLHYRRRELSEAAAIIYG